MTMTEARPVLVPDGRYAMLNKDDGKIHFFEVNTPERGKWKGYTFVSALASDTKYPIRDHAKREQILNAIVRIGVADCLKTYGKHIGVCGHCYRTLTDEDSRSRGIGPVCAKKLGY